MPIILCTGDWQASFSNLNFCQKAHEQELEIIRKYNVDVHVDVGDVKNAYNNIDCRVTDFVVRRDIAIANICTHVIRLLGNHDRIGQYDDKNNWFETFKLTRQANVAYVTEPEILDVGIRVACLPYRSSPEATIKAAKILSKKNADILLFHNDVSGIDYGKGRTSESRITKSAMRFSEYDYCFGGHIHKAQHLADNAEYVGNPFATDFGEIDQPKSFVLYDTETQKVMRIPSKVPGVFSWGYLKKHNIKSLPSGTRIRAMVPCKDAEGYRNRLDRVHDKIVKKFPDAVPFVLPKFVKDADKHDVALDETNSDAQIVAQYVRSTLPQELKAQRKDVVNEMLDLLHRAGTKNLIKTSGRVTFNKVWAENVLSFGKRVEFDLRKRGLVLIKGENRDWPGHSSGCLAKGTLIDVPRDIKKYPNGIPIEKLVGKRPFVYSYSNKHGLCLKKALWVKKTGDAKKVIKIKFRETFGRNKGNSLPFINELVLTPEHKVMLRSGKWCEAQNLRPGDRIMPMLRSSKYTNYFALTDAKTGKQTLEHRFVLEQLTGENYGVKEMHGHHVNSNTFDNRPKNLQWRKPDDHFNLHAVVRHAKHSKNWGWQNTEEKEHPRGMLGKKHTEAIKKQISESLHGKPKHSYDAGKLARFKKLGWTKKLLNNLYHKQGLTKYQIAYKYKTFPYHVISALKMFKLPIENNHRVLSVKKCGRADVYDICVPDTHSFFANGVVVHNSGKTSILNIPPIALFGETLKGQKNDAWASDFTDATSIAGLSLENTRGQQIDITRHRRPSKLQMHVNGKDESSGLRNTGKQETQGQIEALTGLTFDTLANSVYIDQRFSNAFLTGTAKDRADLIHQFQNLERFADAKKLAADESKSLHSMLDTFQSAEAQYRNAEDELKESKREQKTKVGGELSKLRKAYKQAKTDLRKFSVSTAKRYALLQRNHGRLHDAIAEHNKKINNIEGEIHSLEEQKYGKEKAIKTLAQNTEAVCSVCLRPYDENSKRKALANMRTEVGKLDNSAKQIESHIGGEKQKIKVFRKKMEYLSKTIADLDSQESFHTRKARESKAAYLAAKHIAKSSKNIDYDASMRRIQILLKTAYRAIADAKSDIAISKYIQDAFSRDGLPAYLSHLLIPHLNKAAQRYSDIFVDGEIQVLFDIEKSQIIPRVLNAHGGKTMQAQSMGETAWAGIITSFALRDIAPASNLLILDEPGNGMDPESAKIFAQRLPRLQKHFETILVVTHNPIIAEQLDNSNSVTVVKQNKQSKLVANKR